jgi:hypothetical protein
MSNAPCTQAEQVAAQRQESLDAQQAANAAQERELRNRIEALQRREYRAPANPMGCKDERFATLACYRSTRGSPPGVIVDRCQQAVDDLEKCAALLREAALANITSEAIKGQ